MLPVARQRPVPAVTKCGGLMGSGHTGFAGGIPVREPQVMEGKTQMCWQDLLENTKEEMV